MTLRLLAVFLVLLFPGCVVRPGEIPVSQTGEKYLHEQFWQARKRMFEPYILAGEDTFLLYRTFQAQLERLGDRRFSAALSKEDELVIAAVRGFIQPTTVAEYPLTKALLSSAPHFQFPAERVTQEDSVRR